MCKDEGLCNAVSYSTGAPKDDLTSYLSIFFGPVSSILVQIIVNTGGIVRL